MNRMQTFFFFKFEGFLEVLSYTIWMYPYYLVCWKTVWAVAHLNKKKNSFTFLGNLLTKKIKFHHQLMMLRYRYTDLLIEMFNTSSSFDMLQQIISLQFHVHVFFLNIIQLWGYNELWFREFGFGTDWVLNRGTTLFRSLLFSFQFHTELE